MLAVDNAKSSLAEVTAAISSGLGSGKVRKLSEAEADALLLKDDAVSSLQVCCDIALLLLCVSLS